MSWLILAACLLVGLFGFVVFFGAPYLPTLTPQVKAALELADLQAGQHLLELGCGDGKILVAAAKQGIRITGYELNPILAFVCWARTRRYRHLVTVHCQDFWQAQWPDANAVFVFLLPKYMSRLDERLTALTQPVRLISFAFTVPDKEPTAQRDGVFRYDYHK